VHTSPAVKIRFGSLLPPAIGQLPATGRAAATPAPPRADRQTGGPHIIIPGAATARHQLTATEPSESPPHDQSPSRRSAQPPPPSRQHQHQPPRRDPGAATSARHRAGHSEEAPDASGRHHEPDPVDAQSSPPPPHASSRAAAHGSGAPHGQGSSPLPVESASARQLARRITWLPGAPHGQGSSPLQTPAGVTMSPTRPTPVESAAARQLARRRLGSQAAPHGRRLPATAGSVHRCSAGSVPADSCHHAELEYGSRTLRRQASSPPPARASAPPAPPPPAIASQHQHPAMVVL